MTADLIIHNAKIYTVDLAQPWAEAVACRDGQIVAVGRASEIVALAGPDTQMMDVAGRLVLPGLIDAHVHFLQYAIRQQQVNLFGLRDFGQVRQRVQQAVAEAGPGQWVQGWGWDENLWDTQPHASWLDEIAVDIPVVLARMDMHTWWVNGAAMRQAGIDRHTPDPPESRLERDQSGQPTGILREWNAIRLVRRHIPDPDPESLYHWLKQSIGTAHQLGLTGIHDQRLEREGRQSFRLWQRLVREDALDLRVHMNLAAGYLAEIDTLGLHPGFGNDRLWLGHVKAFSDGAMGSRTARMLAPFEGEPDNTGVVVTSSERLAELTAQAQQAGFSMSVHAIGDRAVRDVIDVLSEFPPNQSPAEGRLPHRIEHVQIAHPDDLPRLKQHGLVASMQPIHLASDWFTANKVWGERARYAYAFRTLLDYGTHLALGSDAPVAPLNPFHSIQAAVTRQDLEGQPANGWYPEETISLAEVIAGYTVGPAHLAGKGAVQGSISAGKWADLIVLDQNIFEIAASDIAQTDIKATVFDGRVVFGR